MLQNNSTESLNYELSMEEEMCTPNSSYNISEDEAQVYIYPKGHIFLVTVILPFIFCIGLVSNAAFIYVAMRIKHMRTVTNKYLLNLSISDIIFLAAAIGDKLWKYMSSPVMGDYTSIGHAGCILGYFLSDMSYFASLIFVTIVSLDRFLAVCRPQDRNNPIKGKSTHIVAASWILSCILAGALIPANAAFAVYCTIWPDITQFAHWPSVISFCFPVRDWFGDFATGVQTIPFFVTLVLNLYLYVSIIKGLDECIERMSQHGVAKSKDSSMRQQIARMLVVNGVTFFFLLAPFELGSLFQMIASLRGGATYIYLISNSTARSYMMLLARIMSYFNSAINPLIYTAMCRRYREAFKQAFIPVSWRNRFEHGLSPRECRVSALPSQTDETKLHTEINDTNL